MARKTYTVLTDDIDGGEASGTVEFALDGVSYEIDLNEENAEKLRETLSSWISSGRRIGGRRRPGTASGSQGSSDAAQIRAWAKENGVDVPERGRISAEVREAYAAAH